MSAPIPIGEVIESGTMSFVAQCLEIPRQSEPRLYDPPPFGSFVKIERDGVRAAASAPSTLPFDEPDPFTASAAAAFGPVRLAGDATYALVCSARTTSIDPFRRPTALGMETEDEMRRRQPQIFELLRTEFSGLLVAYTDGQSGVVRRHLPPVPPRLHSRVLPCTEDEIRALTDDLSFLRGVLSGTSVAGEAVPAEELAGACLRAARDVHPGDQAFLIGASRQLAALIPDQYDRLQAILRTVK